MLSDGQHRLCVVVEADVKIDMDVRVGISLETFIVTDAGALRTRGDVLITRGA